VSLVAVGSLPDQLDQHDLTDTTDQKNWRKGKKQGGPIQSLLIFSRLAGSTA